MAYCTIEQLTDRYGADLLVELSDRAGGDMPETPDADLFDRAIADADALIDGYLKPRYALPLASVPHLVRDLSLRISIYYAHGRTVNDKVKADYEAALKQLLQISRGELRLDIAGAEPTGSGAGEVRTNNPDRPMNTGTMKGYI